MLSSADKLDLIDALCATAEAMGATLSPNAARMMADDLEAYDVPILVRALHACRHEVQGRLTLAAIMLRVHAADGRPGKDEAWSIALSASDEFETVVLTSEIRQAMQASAPILSLGDKVGARMAFIGAYERLVAQSRAEAVPVSWSVSLGFDPGRRVAAVESAHRSQLITQEQAAGYLADLRIEPVTQDGLAIAGLLTGNVREVSAKNREKLAEVRSIVAAATARKERERAKQAQADRVNTYLRKRQLRAVLAAHAKGARP
jgi:hypothetical protein